VTGRQFDLPDAVRPLLRCISASLKTQMNKKPCNIAKTPPKLLFQMNHARNQP